MLSELVSLPRLIHGTENFRLEVSWKSSRPKIAIRQRGSSQTTRWTYTASDCNYEKAIKLGNDMAPRLHVCLCVCACTALLLFVSVPSAALVFSCSGPRLLCSLFANLHLPPGLPSYRYLCFFYVPLSVYLSLSLWLSFPRLGCLYLALRLTRSLCPTLSLLSIYLPISLPFVLCFSLCFSLFLSPSLVN